MEIIIIVAVVVIVLFLIYIGIVNGLNRSIVKIDEAASGIDVALTKRYDVLTKMMDTCKSFVKHENEIMFKVIELRSGSSIKEKNEANNAMSENYRNLLAVAENYPELKSSETFVTLQKSILDVEEHLQAARRLYNSNVSSYNQQIVTFPTSAIANMKGFTKKDFFEAEESKRADVKIDI